MFTVGHGGGRDDCTIRDGYPREPRLSLNPMLVRERLPVHNTEILKR